MSTIIKGKFNCPHCQKEFESDMYKVIDISENKDYRTRFINSDFFKYTCPHCGKVFAAFYPVLYIDHSNKFMVQYTPKEMFDEMLKIVKTNAEKIKSSYTLRMCETVYDAVEKVIVLENRLDDRALECSKVIIHKSYLDKFKDKRVHHIYFNVDEKHNFYYDILVQNEDNTRSPFRTNFDFNLYNKIYKDFRREFKDDDYVVDYGYGLRMMKKGPDSKNEKAN